MSPLHNKPFTRVLWVMSLLLTLSGCGGSSSSDSTQVPATPRTSQTEPPAQVFATVSASQAKVLSFSWNEVNADHYKLLKNPDGLSGFTQVGANIRTTSVDEPISVYLQDWDKASYIVQACSSSGACSDSDAISAKNAMLGAIGYFKGSSDLGAANEQGSSVALSAEGDTLAVGSGSIVYVYHLIGGDWHQQAELKGSNTDVGDYFGQSIALSSDGNTLAVSAEQDDSKTTGINNGGQDDDSVEDAGAVYLFTRTGTIWSQQAYIKASNTGRGDFFGYSVALSADGNTLAVGAYGEDSKTTGINNGAQDDDSVEDAGAVYLFTRTGTIWSQQAYIKASNTGGGDFFGQGVALSADGNTLAVGAPNEASKTTGINNGAQEDNSEQYAGAAYLFTRTGTTWSQQAYIKASNTGGGDFFGWSVALSADGGTLAVSAAYEDSKTTGINNGAQDDNSEQYAGAAYLFTRTGTTWSQQAYIKASNTGGGDYFGYSVALSADGGTLVVSAPNEASRTKGINNGDQDDDSVAGAGAVYLFTRTDTTWSQQAYIKASNTDLGDTFGVSVALSKGSGTLAVGAPNEASKTMGINGDQEDNSEQYAGAAYLY